MHAAAGSSFTALARTHAQVACEAAVQAFADSVLLVMFWVSHTSTIEESHCIYQRAIMSFDGALTFEVLKLGNVVNYVTCFV